LATLPCRSCIIRLWQFGILKIEIWQILVNVVMKNPLYRSKSYFSGRNLAKKIPVKETLPLILNSGCEPVFSFHFSNIDILVKFNPKNKGKSLCRKMAKFHQEKNDTCELYMK
jgi:hypothetical protein